MKRSLHYENEQISVSDEVGFLIVGLGTRVYMLVLDILKYQSINAFHFSSSQDAMPIGITALTTLGLSGNVSDLSISHGTGAKTFADESVVVRLLEWTVRSGEIFTEDRSQMFYSKSRNTWSARYIRSARNISYCHFPF
jgi:hypothetical protein